MKRLFSLRYARAGSLMFVVLAATWPAIVRADAPGVRGPEATPAGGIGSAVWSDIQALPPIGISAPSINASAGSEQAVPGRPATIVYGQATDQPTGMAAFSLRALNPGNWVLDAGLGIVSATMSSIQQTLLMFVSTLAGVSLPDPDSEFSFGCDGGLGFLFCTKSSDLLPPGDMIRLSSAALAPGQAVESAGVTAQALQSIWFALQPAAIGILTIVFTVRLGRVMSAGPAAFHSEAKAILFPFLAACVMVAAAPALLRPLLDFFTAVNHGILSNGVFGSGELAIPGLTYVPVDYVTTLAIGPVVALLTMYVVVFIAFCVALLRLVKLTLLFALAPLAGATLVDRSTAHFFGTWFAKILELLLHQLGWSIAVLAGSAILNTLVPLRRDAVVDVASFTHHVIGTTLILVFMLCSQQMFSGVVAVAAGAQSPVLGGSMNNLTTGLSVYHGIKGMFARAPQSLAGRTIATAAAPGGSRRPPVVGAHTSGQPSLPGSTGAATPGLAARRVARRPAPPSPAVPTLPVAATPAGPPAAAPNNAAIGYVAAGRQRSLQSAQPALPVLPAVAANLHRAALVARLQAQAAYTGRQAWRAAPAALAQNARWGAVPVSSAAGQRALRELTRRPPRASRNAS